MAMRVGCRTLPRQVPVNSSYNLLTLTPNLRGTQQIPLAPQCTSFPNSRPFKHLSTLCHIMSSVCLSWWWANSTEFNAKWEGRKLLMDAPITGLKLSVRKELFLSHMEDNCDTCAKSKTTISAKQTTINQLWQSAQASPEIMKVEDEIKTLRQENETHQGEANRSHADHVDMTECCSSEWAEIASLKQKATLTDEETVTLDGLKKRFTLVLSADFQVCKLVPYLGYSAQPGSTHLLSSKTQPWCVWCSRPQHLVLSSLFDECVGPKNTDKHDLVPHKLHQSLTTLGEMHTFIPW